MSTPWTRRLQCGCAAQGHKSPEQFTDVTQWRTDLHSATAANSFNTCKLTMPPPSRSLSTRPYALRLTARRTTHWCRKKQHLRSLTSSESNLNVEGKCPRYFISRSRESAMLALHALLGFPIGIAHLADDPHKVPT